MLGKWLGTLGKVTHKGPPRNPFGQRAKAESEVLAPGLSQPVWGNRPGLYSKLTLPQAEQPCSEHPVPGVGRPITGRVSAEWRGALGVPFGKARKAEELLFWPSRPQLPGAAQSARPGDCREGDQR